MSECGRIFYKIYLETLNFHILYNLRFVGRYIKKTEESYKIGIDKSYIGHSKQPGHSQKLVFLEIYFVYSFNAFRIYQSFWKSGCRNFPWSLIMQNNWCSTWLIFKKPFFQGKSLQTKQFYIPFWFCLKTYSIYSTLNIKVAECYVLYIKHFDMDFV